MKIQCCFCKHICCNHEYDEMLDCEIALEESGKPKCYQNNFDKFELEQNEEVCKSYLKAFDEEYGLYERIKDKKHNISYDVPFENFMSSTKEEWDDRPRT